MSSKLSYTVGIPFKFTLPDRYDPTCYIVDYTGDNPSAEAEMELRRNGNYVEWATYNDLLKEYQELKKSFDAYKDNW